ncbi:MAG: tetratricopeptide repeat protein, partial [Cyanobacteria bacterium P01_D01_bin.56]
MALDQWLARGVLATLLLMGSTGFLIPVHAMPKQQAAVDSANEQALQRAYELSAQGFNLYQQGRYAEAEPLYQESLRIYRVALGERHPDVATGLNNLAELYRDQGRYAEA